MDSGRNDNRSRIYYIAYSLSLRVADRTGLKALFAGFQSEQIKFVNDISRYPVSELSDIYADISDISGRNSQISDECTEKIIQVLKRRTDLLNI